MKPLMRFKYGTQVTLDVVNNGSPDTEKTVRSSVPAGAGQLQVGGVTYTLLQFHFHTRSEHLVEGKEFPMEMHLVHQASNGAYLVVGVFIEEGALNVELNKIFAQLPQASGDSLTVSVFNLRKILPTVHDSFRYTGSLTTPDFNEGVNWVVMTEPIELSPRQIREFRALFPDGNKREAQPLNGRTISTDFNPDFDVQLQDDRTGDSLLINSYSGEYKFVRCGPNGFTFTGKGEVHRTGYGLSLDDGRRVLAEVGAGIVGGIPTGSARIRPTAPFAATYFIHDRDFTNNTRTCP